MQQRHMHDTAAELQNMPPGGLQQFASESDVPLKLILN